MTPWSDPFWTGVAVVVIACVILILLGDPL